MDTDYGLRQYQRGWIHENSAKIHNLRESKFPSFRSVLSDINSLKKWKNWINWSYANVLRTLALLVDTFSEGKIKLLLVLQFSEFIIFFDRIADSFITCAKTSSNIERILPLADAMTKIVSSKKRYQGEREIDWNKNDRCLLCILLCFVFISNKTKIHPCVIHSSSPSFNVLYYFAMTCILGIDKIYKNKKW